MDFVVVVCLTNVAAGGEGRIVRGENLTECVSLITKGTAFVGILEALLTALVFAMNKGTGDVFAAGCVSATVRSTWTSPDDVELIIAFNEP